MIEASPSACSTWVRQFYDILFAMFWEDPHPFFRVWRVYIPLKSYAINKALEVQEVPNHAYENRLREMDLECLRDTLVDPTE